MMVGIQAYRHKLRDKQLTSLDCWSCWYCQLLKKKEREKLENKNYNSKHSPHTLRLRQIQTRGIKTEGRLIGKKSI